MGELKGNLRLSRQALASVGCLGLFPYDPFPSMLSYDPSFYFNTLEGRGYGGIREAPLL